LLNRGTLNSPRWLNIQAIHKDYERQAKRQKLSGTNSRFDRMIETVKMMHHSPVKTSHRHRTRSVGSSTTNYHGVPQTPVAAYEGWDTRSLGKDFAPIKMNAGHTSDLDESLHDASKASLFGS
jgi:hypothetical protein